MFIILIAFFINLEEVFYINICNLFDNSLGDDPVYHGAKRKLFKNRNTTVEN